MFGDQAATDAAFAKAKHVVKLRIENNRLTPISMEPRIAIGDYDAADDHYTLYTCVAESARRAHGDGAHLPCAREPDPRGLAGCRRRLRPEGRAFPDDVLVLWASKKLGRPVKWVATRSESMLTDRTAARW